MTNIVTPQTFATAFNASTQALVITKPTGLAVGDLMIAQISEPDGAVTLSAPAGWATVLTTSATTIQTKIFSKIADAADVAASNFTFTTSSVGNDVMMGGIARIDGFYTTTPVGNSHGTAQTGQTTLTDSGITPTLANGLYLVFVTAQDTDGAFATTGTIAMVTSNPVSWTEAWDVGNNSGGVGFTFAMGYGSRSPFTATGNVTAVMSDDNARSIIQVVNLNATPITSMVLGLTSEAAVAALVPPSMVVGITSEAPTTPAISDWNNVEKSGESFSELVTNGGFTSDLSGWNNLAPGDFVWTSGAAKCAVGGGFMYQDIALILGETYTFSFDYASETGSSEPFGFSWGGGDSNSVGLAESTDFVNFSWEFVADADDVASPRVGFQGTNAKLLIDNVSVTGLTGSAPSWVNTPKS